MDHTNFDTLALAAKAVDIQLGCGYTESVYERALDVELQSRGWRTDREREVPISYRDSKNIFHTVGSGRIDILAFPPCLGAAFILELKVSSSTASKPAHRSQLLAYSRMLPNAIPVLITFRSSISLPPLVEFIGQAPPLVRQPTSELKSLNNFLNKKHTLANHNVAKLEETEQYVQDAHSDAAEKEDEKEKREDELKHHVPGRSTSE